MREDGKGGGTYEHNGDRVGLAGLGDDSDYKLVDDVTQEQLAPYLETLLPPKFIDQEWPWLEPGSVYRGGSDGPGNAYICVLENGRDVLIGSKRQVYMTVLAMAFERGHKNERCLAFVGSRDRHVWSYSNKGNIMDHWRSEHHLPGEKPFERTTEYDFVVDELKKMYGFWTHPKKE